MFFFFLRRYAGKECVSNLYDLRSVHAKKCKRFFPYFHFDWLYSKNVINKDFGSWCFEEINQNDVFYSIMKLISLFLNPFIIWRDEKGLVCLLFSPLYSLMLHVLSNFHCIGLMIVMSMFGILDLSVELWTMSILLYR